MVVTCITLCNSACITCIWCFLLSICFPKFVQSMEETDSSECCARKFRDQRESSESFRAREIQKQNRKIRETDVDKRRVSRYEEPISSRESYEPINDFHRRSRDVESLHPDLPLLRERSMSLDTLNSMKVDQNNRYSDLKVQKRSSNGMNVRDQGRKYRLYAKLSRVASGLEERFLEKQPLRQHSYNKPIKCYRRCGNHESRHQRNRNYNPRFLED